MISVCNSISEKLGLLYMCKRVGQHVRVRTPLLYPDGGFVDLYVGEFDGIRTVTDLGETMRRLSGQSWSGKLSPKQLALFQETARLHGVETCTGALMARAADEGGLVDAIERVGQACLRASCGRSRMTY